MHNATTKQRLAALRRKLGIFASTPRWVKEGRARRLARLEAALAIALPFRDGSETVFPAPASPTPAADPALATTEVEQRGRPAPGGRRRGAAGLAVALVVATGTLLLWLSASSRAPEPAPPAAAIAPPTAVPPARAAAAVAAPVGAALPTKVAAPAAAELEVRPGDTLWHLSARHLGAPGAWPRLHAANGARVRDPDLIFPGQRLRLPGP
jgi:nucleoid-associated protein YgaU